MPIKSFKPIRVKRDATIDLICFPYAGSGASLFTSWLDYLDLKINLYGFQAPGKEDRISEDLIEDLDSLVQLATQEIQQLIQGPFVLFGHSLGSVLAFEITKSLEKQAISPKLMILSGRQPPEFGSKMQSISHLGDDAFIEQLKKLQGSDSRVLENRELMELLLPIIRADFKISECYRDFSGLKVQCPLIALGSNDDPWINKNDFNAWQNYSHKPVKIQFFPGGHFYIKEHHELLCNFLNAEILQT